MSEAKYMEDGADYLEEGCQRQICDGCMAYNYCLIREQGGGRTMRLIDADAFEKSVMFGDAEDMQDVIYALRDYPITYDIDKVVERLEELEGRYDSVDFGIKGIICKAIEIVKSGAKYDD